MSLAVRNGSMASLYALRGLKLVGVAGGGTPTRDAVTAAGRIDASRMALLSLSCGSVLIQSSMDAHQGLGTNREEK